MYFIIIHHQLGYACLLIASDAKYLAQSETHFPSPRCLDFTVALFQRLVADPGQKMEQIVEESYTITLKPWHGWISTAAYKVIICFSLLPPSNKRICLCSVLIIRAAKSLPQKLNFFQSLFKIVFPKAR